MTRCGYTYNGVEFPQAWMYFAQDPNESLDARVSDIFNFLTNCAGWQVTVAQW